MSGAKDAATPQVNTPGRSKIQNGGLLSNKPKLTDSVRKRIGTRSRNFSGDNPTIDGDFDCICDTCEVKFVSDTDKFLVCLYCNNRRCTKCLGLNSTVHKAVSGRTDMPWFCQDCLVKTKKMIREAKSVEDQCAKFIEKYEKKVEERVESIEKNVKEMIEGMKTMKNDILAEVRENSKVRCEQSKSVKEIKSKVSESPDSFEQQHLPIKQSIPVQRQIPAQSISHQSIEDRRNNIVLFNVPELNSNIKDEVKQHDVEMLVEVAHAVGAELSNEDILSIKRVGKKDQKKNVNGVDKVLPRIVIAKLTESNKQKLMKNAYKLQYGAEKVKNIGMKHDMSKEEREKEAELRREAKELEEKMSNQIFRFLVKGPPWDRQIVKVKRREIFQPQEVGKGQEATE